MTLALQPTGITKPFPGVIAGDYVNFSLEKGDIHALLGENGAGSMRAATADGQMLPTPAS